MSNKEFALFLLDAFQEIAREKGFRILACDILADHVHVLIEQEVVSYSTIMKYLKGISARRFFSVYPSNRFVDRKLWGRSYYYQKVDEEELGRVINYIKSQKTEEGLDKRYG